MPSILIPFITVALAELLDKSQLTLLFVSSKTKRSKEVLLGALLAFALVDGIAILFGSFIATIIPINIAKLISAGVFIFFGIQALRSQKDTKESKKIQQIKHPFFTAFSLVFFAEWGDKTQLASAAFSELFPPLHVFIGVILAMTLLSGIAVFAGKYILKYIPQKTMQLIGGIVYILVGISFLLV